jgi:hypothetical protein
MHESNHSSLLAKPVTRAHLESLATRELLRLADNLGIDIPPDLDRVFIIEEILDSASSDFDDDTAPDSADSADFLSGVAVPPPTKKSGDDETDADTDTVDAALRGSVLLPDQYHITYIKVIVRDPLWAFVFWEIKQQEKEQLESAEDFAGYYLKVSCIGEKGAAFTVPVSPEDTGRYLALSPDARRYAVELCADTQEGELILAASCPFTLPRLHELPAGKEAQRFQESYPLAALSGYGDIHILYSNEQLSRRGGKGEGADNE